LPDATTTTDNVCCVIDYSSSSLFFLSRLEREKGLHVITGAPFYLFKNIESLLLLVVVVAGP
jgi:hypothetical protein